MAGHASRANATPLGWVAPQSQTSGQRKSLFKTVVYSAASRRWQGVDDEAGCGSQQLRRDQRHGEGCSGCPERRRVPREHRLGAERHAGGIVGRPSLFVGGCRSSGGVDWFVQFGRQRECGAAAAPRAAEQHLAAQPAQHQSNALQRAYKQTLL